MNRRSIRRLLSLAVLHSFLANSAVTGQTSPVPTWWNDASYSSIHTNITVFPYLACDNDLGHSPLRLNYSAIRGNNDSSVTYCWNVTLSQKTQCASGPKGTCCTQDLGGIYFEIRDECPASVIKSVAVQGMAIQTRILVPATYSRALHIQFSKSIPFKQVEGRLVCINLQAPCRTLSTFCRNGNQCIVSLENVRGNCCPSSLTSLSPPAPPLSPPAPPGPKPPPPPSSPPSPSPPPPPPRVPRAPKVPAPSKSPPPPPPDRNKSPPPSPRPPPVPTQSPPLEAQPLFPPSSPGVPGGYALRLAIWTLEPISDSRSQVTASCSNVASYYNTNYLSQVNTISPLACTQPIQFTPGYWVITMFAWVQSPADAAKVLYQIQTTNGLDQVSSLTGWPCTTSELCSAGMANTCLPSSSMLRAVSCGSNVVNAPPAPPAPPPPAGLPPQGCPLTFAGVSSPGLVRSQAQAYSDCVNGAVAINQLLITGASLMTPFTCSSVQFDQATSVWRMLIPAVASSTQDAVQVILNFFQGSSLPSIASTIGWPCANYTLTNQCTAQGALLYSNCQGSPPPPPKSSLPPPPPYVNPGNGVSMRLTVYATQAISQTSLQVAATCTSVANTFNSLYLTSANMISRFACQAPIQYGPGLWMISSFALASSANDAVQVMSNVNSNNGFDNIAAITGWPCTSVGLSSVGLPDLQQAGCRGPSSPPPPTSLIVTSPPPPPVISSPPPPPMANGCKMSFVGISAPGLVMDQAQAAKDCARGAAAINAILLNGAAVVSPFSCLPAQNYPPRWVLAMPAVAATNQDAYQIILNFLQGNALPSIANIIGWPCTNYTLYNECTSQAAIQYSNCPVSNASPPPPLAQIPASPPPPRPVNAKGPPPPPPAPFTWSPWGNTCFIKYAASGMNQRSNQFTSFQISVSQMCANVAAQIIQLYDTGVNISIPWTCSQAYNNHIEILMYPSSAADQIKFFKNFGTGISGFMPLMPTMGWASSALEMSTFCPPFYNVTKPWAPCPPPLPPSPPPTCPPGAPCTFISSVGYQFYCCGFSFEYRVGVPVCTHPGTGGPFVDSSCTTLATFGR